MKLRTIVKLIIALLIAYSVFIIWLVPQPYGYVSLGVLGITLLFSFIKNKKIFIALTILGICGSGFAIVSAHKFLAYTKTQGEKFNIPTAVQFEKIDFNTALAKAKNENKYVFIDMYATWCGPCLKFTQTVLCDEEVGRAMNASFINLKYDTEKGEGKTLAQRYDVRSWPTLLILDNEGNVLENLVDKYLPGEEKMIKVAQKYRHIPK